MNYNDIIGTVGVGMILIAYILNISSFIPKDGKLYFFMNILGATLACYASILINYKPFILLEGTWAVVSLFGLINLLKNKNYA